MTDQSIIDISIIIPCYNRINLLKETLKSVEAAIHHLNAEVILVDDGSSPPISGQIPEFAHLPLLIIRQENSGLTTARYNGLMSAKGKYIQFLDSDDQIAPEKFDKQLETMRLRKADISHTDIAEYVYDSETQKSELQTVRKVLHSTDPAEFFVRVQPSPHSPVFRREYILPHILNAFIPLSREYDSIGEVWFYYNLSVYPAVIIKVDEPLTLIIHHDNGRLTDNWELMGLCALSLQYQFALHFPFGQYPESAAKKRVAIAAFNTFKQLPSNVNKSLQNAYLDIWRKLGKAKINELDAGLYFSILAYTIGAVNAARIFKLRIPDYNQLRSVSDEQLESRLQIILHEFGGKQS